MSRENTNQVVVSITTARWKRKLAERLSRLNRLIELNAPEPIIESEQELVRGALANLARPVAVAVMAKWPHLAAQFDRA